MLNALLLVTGAFIGFLSICVRRILSAIIGLIWGAGIGFLVALLISYNSNLGTEGSIVIILIFAVLVAVISYKYYRFFVFLNTFLVSLGLFYILAELATNDTSTSIIIAIVLALVAGIISAILYDPLFIISTAFLGGSLMSLGGVALAEDSFFLYVIDDSRVPIFAIILGILGVIIQFALLKKMNIGRSDNSYKKSLTATKKCRQCQEIYTGSSGCPKCGSSFYEEVNIAPPNQ